MSEMGCGGRGRGWGSPSLAKNPLALQDGLRVPLPPPPPHGSLTQVSGSKPAAPPVVRGSATV